jgi:hypothetical protein
MVTRHLTRAKFGMEIFKFCLCLSIPGMAVLVFRVSASRSERTHAACLQLDTDANRLLQQLCTPPGCLRLHTHGGIGKEALLCVPARGEG